MEITEIPANESLTYAKTHPKTETGGGYDHTTNWATSAPTAKTAAAMRYSRPDPTAVPSLELSPTNPRV